MCCLFNGKRLNWTVICHMPMLTTNHADSDQTEASGVAPSTAKVALGSETRRGGVSRGRLTTMGTDVEWAIFSIMAEIMTPKALSEGRCGSVVDRDVDDSSGGRESLCSIRERDEKGPIESEDFLINSSILGLGFHGGGRRRASRRRGQRESR